MAATEFAAALLGLRPKFLRLRVAQMTKARITASKPFRPVAKRERDIPAAIGRSHRRRRRCAWWCSGRCGDDAPTTATAIRLSAELRLSTELRLSRKRLSFSGRPVHLIGAGALGGGISTSALHRDCSVVEAVAAGACPGPLPQTCATAGPNSAWSRGFPAGGRLERSACRGAIT